VTINAIVGARGRHVGDGKIFVQELQRVVRSGRGKRTSSADAGHGRDAQVAVQERTHVGGPGPKGGPSSGGVFMNRPSRRPSSLPGPRGRRGFPPARAPDGRSDARRAPAAPAPLHARLQRRNPGTRRSRQRVPLDDLLLQLQQAVLRDEPVPRLRLRRQHVQGRRGRARPPEGGRQPARPAFAWERWRLSVPESRLLRSLPGADFDLQQAFASYIARSGAVSGSSREIRDPLRLRAHRGYDGFNENVTRGFSSATRSPSPHRRQGGLHLPVTS